MTITKTNNGLLISTILNGYRVKQMYQGYDKKTAKKLFTNYLKTIT